MSDMPGFRKQRPADRWITNAQRQRADRANKAEVNYAGVELPKKNTIKLHEDFTCTKFPPAEIVKADILDFHARTGQVPTEIHVPFSTTTNSIHYHCPTLGLDWPIVALRVVRGGEFLELK